MENNNIVILLTACINPNGMAYTVLQDKDARLRQYREALDWYLNHVKNKIVFVENTGYNISPYYEYYIEAGQLEVLTFQGNDFDKKKGKGYGEALIIEYALNNSVFFRCCDVIIKITGRLICGNIMVMVKKYTNKNTIYALKKKDDKDGYLLNSQVIAAPLVFWKDYFVLKKDLIDDSRHYWFEHLLYDASKKWEKDGFSFKDAWIVFKIKGVSGSNGNVINYPHLNNPFVFYLHYLLNKINYYGSLKFWRK